MDRYVLGPRLGGGGAGDVFAAHDTVLDRRVAIKFLHLHLADDAEAMARFDAEARSSARVSHPGVVSVYDTGRAPDGRPYIVMECVEGQTLARQVATEGPLPEQRVIDMGAGLADALASAHAAGVIHRDVKPGNVLVADDGRALLTDFGIAKSLHSGDLTGTGKIVGTPAYVAPEVLRGQGSGPAADVYGLGLTLYEALTGSRPFGGTTPMEVALAQRDNDPAPLRSLRPEVSEATEAVVMRALAKEPEARWPSVGALGDALRAVRNGHAPHLPTVAAPMTTVPVSAPGADLPQPPAPRRASLAPGVVIVLTLIALAALLVWLRADRPGTFPAAAAITTTTATTAAPTTTLAPPPRDLGGFITWATDNPDRLGSHADAIIGWFGELDEKDRGDAVALVDDVERWNAAGTIDGDVADALIAALEAAYPEPTEEERGKGNGGKGNGGKGKGDDDD